MEQFREKSIEELTEQLIDVNDRLSSSLAQPSTEEEIGNLSAQELARKFPRRYKIYVDLLRSRRSDSDLSSEDLVDMKRWITMLNRLDAYIEEHKEEEDTRTLRERQFDVFEDIRDFVEQGNNKGYIKLPTGVGKTVLFTEFLEALDTRTLIVVPTTVLVSQTVEALKKFAPDMNFGRVFGKAKELEEDVIVTTYASLVSQVRKGNIDPEDFNLLILDEAHRSLSDLRSETVDRFEGALKLGFTATPTFSQERGLDDLLNVEIHSMTIQEAVKDGLLSSFSVVLARTSVDFSEVRISGDDYSEKELEEALNVERRNRAAVELYSKLFSDEFAVAFCVSVSHAERVAELFNESGVPAAVVTGETKNAQEIFQKYRSGEIKVLCTADKLIEGFDEPRVSVCLNLRPTLSRVVAEQRAGRVLRLDPENPKKFARIVEFLDEKKDGNSLDPITFAEIVGSAEILQEGQEYGYWGFLGGSSAGGAGYQPSDVTIEGLQVTTNTEEVLRMVSSVKENREKSIEDTPDGWLTNAGLAKTVNVDERTVKRYAAQHRTSNPGWFKEYRDSFGRVYEHYSPELILKIKERLERYGRPPEGWLTVSALQSVLGVSKDPIQRRLKSYRSSNSEWFKFFRGDKGVREYLSPELISHLKEEIEAVEDAPMGWMTNKSLAHTLGISTRGSTKLIRPYRISNPEWFKRYKDPGGREYEHVSPELVDKLSSEMTKIEFAPDGWLTKQGMASEIGMDRSTAKRRLKPYRTSNPEWFKRYKDPGGREYEHVSPELISRIREEYDPGEPPPVGWRTNEAVAIELEVDRAVIKRLAEIYRTSNPEWFKEYRSRAGKREHYSPDLVDSIKRKLSSK